MKEKKEKSWHHLQNRKNYRKWIKSCVWEFIDLVLHYDIISIILLQCPYDSETYIGFLFLLNKNSTTEQNFEDRETKREQKIDKPRKARSMITLKQKKLYQMFICNMKTKKLQTMPIHKDISKDFSLSWKLH